MIQGKLTAIISINNNHGSVHGTFSVYLNSRRFPAGRVKLTTSWTVAAPFERRRSVSLPFTILPSVDFGALVLIPIMSGQIHKVNSSD